MLAKYETVHAFLAELQTLAKQVHPHPPLPGRAAACAPGSTITPPHDPPTGFVMWQAEAVDLVQPLARLADECRSRWQLDDGARCALVHQRLASASNLLCSCTDGGGWSLDAVVGWESAVLCDTRLATSLDEPWDLVRAMAHVVKARWLCELCRRSPEDAPRCSAQVGADVSRPYIFTPPPLSLARAPMCVPRARASRRS